MSLFKYAIGFLLGAVFLTACIQPVSEQANAELPKSIISEHLRAYNAGDAEAMAKMQHPDIQWLMVDGNTISVEVAGREALMKSMKSYFQTRTKVTSRLRDWNVNSPYVSVTETVSWAASDGRQKSQSSMTVYELEDNLIRRVWYYPAVDNADEKKQSIIIRD